MGKYRGITHILGFTMIILIIAGLVYTNLGNPFILSKMPNLRLDSGTVLIEGEQLIKSHWSYSERSVLNGVLKRLTAAEEPASSLFCGGPTLSATLGNKEVRVIFLGEFVSMTSEVYATESGFTTTTQWFSCSSEDYQAVRSLLFPSE